MRLHRSWRTARSAYALQSRTAAPPRRWATAGATGPVTAATAAATAAVVVARPLCLPLRGITAAARRSSVHALERGIGGNSAAYAYARPPFSAVAAAQRMATAAAASGSAATAPASGPADAAAGHAAAAVPAPPAAAGIGSSDGAAPWVVGSEHLDPSLPQARQLHLVVLNWHLPVLTARLWRIGARISGCRRVSAQTRRPPRPSSPPHRAAAKPSPSPII